MINNHYNTVIIIEGKSCMRKPHVSIYLKVKNHQLQVNKGDSHPQYQNFWEYFWSSLNFKI